ncbi:MAG: O-antigen ligase family protein [Bacillota bacterium]
MVTQGGEARFPLFSRTMRTRHCRLLTFAILAIALLTIRYLGNQRIPMAIISGLLVFLCLFMSDSELVPAVVFLIPFETAIQIVTIYGAILIMLIARHWHHMRVSFLSIPILSLVVLEGAHVLVTPFDMLQYLKVVVVYSLVAVLVYSDTIRIDYRAVLTWFVVGVCAFSALATVYDLGRNGYSLIQMISSGTRLGDTGLRAFDGGYGLYDNPNAIGTMLCVALSVYLVGLHARGRVLPTDFLLIGMLITVGLLTRSRAFIVTLLAQMTFTMTVSRRLSRWVSGSAAILLIAVLMIIATGRSTFVESVLSRFGVDFLSGRLEVFRAYNAYLLDHPWNLVFGIGLQSMNVKANIIHSPHNVVQEVMVAWGLVGVGIAFLLLLSVFRRGMLKRSQGLMHHLPMFTILFLAQSGQFFSKLPAPVLLVVAFCSYRWEPSRLVTKTHPIGTGV